MCLILRAVQEQEGMLSPHAKGLRAYVGSVRIIAIMLFRIGMTVDEAITAYTTVSKNVFSIRSARSNMKTRASLLENAVTTIIHSSLSVDNIQAQNVRMLDDKGPKWRVVHLTFAPFIDFLAVSLVLRL